MSASPSHSTCRSPWATPPQLRVRSIKTLGTTDADVLRLEQQSLFVAT